MLRRGPWKHYAKSEEPDIKSHLLYDSIYMKFLSVNPGTERLAVTRGCVWGGGGVGHGWQAEGVFCGWWKRSGTEQWWQLHAFVNKLKINESYP